MSNPEGNHTTPAGWYADPAGSTRQRWWDGTGWTDHLQDAPPAAPTSAPAPVHQTAYGQTQAYPSAPAYAYPVGAEPNVPAGTPAYGPFIWVITLLPLISLLMFPLTFGTLQESMRSSMADAYSSNPYAGMSTSGLAGQLFGTLIGWLIVAAIIVLSYFDYKWLLRTGYARPFHWAWSFFALIFPPLYVIGRSVVVRRRSGRGMAPMWVAIGITVVSWIIGIAAVIWAFNETFSMISNSGNLS